MRNVTLSIVAHVGAVAVSAAAVRLFGFWLLYPLIHFFATLIAGGSLLRLFKAMRPRDVIIGAAVAALFVSLGLYVIDWAAATTDDGVKMSEFIRYLVHPPRLGDIVFIIAPFAVMCSAAILALVFRRREATS